MNRKQYKVRETQIVQHSFTSEPAKDYKAKANTPLVILKLSPFNKSFGSSKSGNQTVEKLKLQGSQRDFWFSESHSIVGIMNHRRDPSQTFDPSSLAALLIPWCCFWCVIDRFIISRADLYAWCTTASGSAWYPIVLAALHFYRSRLTSSWLIDLRDIIMWFLKVCHMTSSAFFKK